MAGHFSRPATSTMEISTHTVSASHTAKPGSNASTSNASTALPTNSGSTTPTHNSQEYARWAEVTGFTSTLYTSPAPERIPTMFVCGTQEENLANNVALAAHLAGIGGDIGWGDVPDGHTWTTWRDLLDPHLTRLLQEAWP